MFCRIIINEEEPSPLLEEPPKVSDSEPRIELAVDKGAVGGVALEEGRWGIEDSVGDTISPELRVASARLETGVEWGNGKGLPRVWEELSSLFNSKGEGIELRIEREELFINRIISKEQVKGSK